MLKDKITQSIMGRLDYKVVGLIVAAIFLVLGVSKIFTRTEPPPKAATSSVNNIGVTRSDQETTTLKVQEKIKTEGQRRAREAIEQHEKALAMDFGGEETPDRLMAVGNLYQYQLSDYYSAIQNYRTLIDADPNHSKAPQAYVEIATCYKRLGDEIQERYVYEEMLDTLDPSLQHTKFAKLQLEKD
jgi:tetratricopeptide (TPR) repeat protein